MNPNQVGRRSFLCNIGILATGVAFGGVKQNLLSVDKKDMDLEATWKNFCRQNDATPFVGLLSKKKIITPCKGHKHKEGSMVYFPEGKITAMPVWVYWAADPVCPSDVIVNFYKADGSIITINQYELKALLYLNKQPVPEKNKMISAIFQKDEKELRTLFVRTNIKNNRADIYVLKHNRDVSVYEKIS